MSSRYSFKTAQGFGTAHGKHRRSKRSLSYNSKTSEIVWCKIPKPDDSGCFIPTLNNTGYMTTHLDLYSEAFVQYASRVDGPVLEVGAAYGIATLAALAQGAKILCNDIDSRHLMIVKQKAVEQNLDRSQLITIPGDFSYQVQLPSECLEAILMCRVLYMFDGHRIEHSIKKAYQLLKPGGKIFIVADTPYLKITTSFIERFEERVKQGVKWPGLITNLQEYFKDPILPQVIHSLDLTTMTRVLETQGFIVEKKGFINRLDFPTDRRLDGRESIGLIAVKPKTA